MSTFDNARKILESIPADASFKMRLRILAGIEATERPAVAEHAASVARASAMLAGAVGMDPDEVREVHMAARWHDIGKIAVDQSVLSKPGRLTAVEFEQIMAHAKVGADFLGKAAPRILLDAVSYHHERYDGYGYEQIRGEDIPFVARIIAIADVHDALISRRDYKAPMHEEDALCLMAADVESPGFGRRNFDPCLLRRFVALRLSDPAFSPSRHVRAALFDYARSDPMSDVGLPQDNGGWQLKRSGHRQRFLLDGSELGPVELIHDPAGREMFRRNDPVFEMDGPVPMR